MCWRLHHVGPLRCHGDAQVTLGESALRRPLTVVAAVASVRFGGLLALQGAVGAHIINIVTTTIYVVQSSSGTEPGLAVCCKVGRLYGGTAVRRQHPRVIDQRQA